MLRAGVSDISHDADDVPTTSSGCEVDHDDDGIPAANRVILQEQSIKHERTQGGTDLILEVGRHSVLRHEKSCQGHKGQKKYAHA